MGKALAMFDFLYSFETSDYIDIVSLIVNTCFAVWIVKTIQNKLTNKRVLKDHFINEIKDLRNEYKECFNNLYSGKTNAKLIKSWLKSMNIKVSDLMQSLNELYKVDMSLLQPHQIELRELITENEDYIKCFELDFVEFTNRSKTDFENFQKINSKNFNKIIIQINNYQ